MVPPFLAGTPACHLDSIAAGKAQIRWSSRKLLALDVLFRWFDSNCCLIFIFRVLFPSNGPGPCLLSAFVRGMDKLTSYEMPAHLLLKNGQAYFFDKR